MHIIITGGGTGGHIFPALEIAHEFRLQDPKIRVTYVGNDNGPEKKLAAEHNLPFFALNTHKLVGQSIFKKIRALFYLIISLIRSLKFLRHNRPDAVIGVGGYVSVPLLCAAFLLGIRRYICEQNVIPGLANKFLSLIAERIFISFAESKEFFPPKKIILSGNPVRRAFFELSAKTFLLSQEFRILVSGGSLGASFLNKEVPKALALVHKECPNLSVTHQCGAHKAHDISDYYKNNNINYLIVDFISNMPEAFRNHDILISRAGATIAAEIMASGMPAILVPYRFASGHQRNNALALSAHKASIMLDESENFAYELAQILKNFYNNKKALETLSIQAKTLGNAHASKIIINTVLEECR
jgi:UDP-N-acetylglucosamine--N-acetylmuramyl-(pentapeptide) pyrophosphoryl-undecaprenol N-acetylglucosamine transferase